jgi:hypothetical protein
MTRGGPKTRSVLELAFLDLVDRFGLRAPELNAWLEDRFLAVASVAPAVARAEVDGRRMHGRATAARDDPRLDRLVRAAGYRVLRFDYADVVRWAGETAVRRACAGGAAVGASRGGA